MRDDIGQLQQWIVAGRRFLCEHVEAGAGDLAGRQRCIQRRLIDDPAARRVDEVSCGFHLLQTRSVEHADRFRRLRTMDAYEIGAWEGRIQVRHRLAAGGLDLAGGLVGFVHETLISMA